MFKKYQLLVLVLIFSISLSIKQNPRNKQQKSISTTTTKNKVSEQTKKIQEKKQTHINNLKSQLTVEKQQQQKQTTPSKQKSTQKKAQNANTKSISSSHKASKDTKTVKQNRQKTAGNKKTPPKTEESAQNIGSTTQTATQTSVPANPQKYQHSIGTLFIVYLLIFMVLSMGIKYVYFPNSNFIQLLLDVVILITEYRKKIAKRGYLAPQYNEEVDDSNSITVGYTEDHAKQLFWQRNSVEGI